MKDLDNAWAVMLAGAAFFVLSVCFLVYAGLYDDVIQRKARVFESRRAEEPQSESDEETLAQTE